MKFLIAKVFYFSDPPPLPICPTLLSFPFLRFLFFCLFLRYISLSSATSQLHTEEGRPGGPTFFFLGRFHILSFWVEVKSPCTGSVGRQQEILLFLASQLLPALPVTVSHNWEDIPSFMSPIYVRQKVAPGNPLGNTGPQKCQNPISSFIFFPGIVLSSQSSCIALSYLLGRGTRLPQWKDLPSSLFCLFRFPSCLFLPEDPEAADPATHHATFFPRSCAPHNRQISRIFHPPLSRPLSLWRYHFGRSPRRVRFSISPV